MLKTLTLIGVFGAFGAISRYSVSLWIYAWLGRGFPYGTLFVNVIGSFLIGLLAMLFVSRMDVDPAWRAGILIGFLGAFTTFSTFSLETLNLIEDGDILLAAMNMLLSLVLCIMAVWAGVLIGRQW